jgi:hypothetical protein
MREDALCELLAQKILQLVCLDRRQGQTEVSR